MSKKKKNAAAAEQAFITEAVGTALVNTEYTAHPICLLNVRKEPAGEILRTIDVNDAVEVLEVAGDWARTELGWVMVKYLTNK